MLYYGVADRSFYAMGICDCGIADGWHICETEGGGLRPVVTLKTGLTFEETDDHESGYKTWNIVEQAPLVTLNLTEFTTNSFVLNAIAITGREISKYELYIYEENGNLKTKIPLTRTDQNVNFEITEGISDNTTYTAKVIVYDSAGKSTTSNVVTITTKLDGEANISNVVKVGDFINYDAGVWTEEDIQKIENSVGEPSVHSSVTNLNEEIGEITEANQFGGFQVGDSKNGDALFKMNDEEGYWSIYDGWRVWSIEDDTVTLISAAGPEVYGVSSMFGEESDKEILLNRDCSMYINEYAKSAHLLNTDDLREWILQNFEEDRNFYDENGYIDYWWGNDWRRGKEASLLGTVGFYVLPGTLPHDLEGITSVTYFTSGLGEGGFYNSVYGDGVWPSLVRPLVTLKTNVLVSGGDAHESGFRSWEIEGMGPDTTPPTVTIDVGALSSTMFGIGVDSVADDVAMPETPIYYYYGKPSTYDEYVLLYSGTETSYTWNISDFFDITGDYWDIKVEVSDAAGNIGVGEKLNYKSCFVAGTKVLTENGLMNIEDIEVGMKVYSKNEVTGEIELKSVLQTHKNKVDFDMCKVYVNGNVIESTSGHEFYELNKGWTPAKELKSGDVLLDNNNEQIIIYKVEYIKFSGDELITVYNLTVEDNHNYFVGENSVWVHNSPFGICIAPE